ncbi:hypothetical protein GGE45_005909 [Rhizobium aethiopicum]|uniref:hypothetical protein n=1 Tax=Rhizobium aethiopicum TaxID=1138170 RepID=UPI00161DB3C0|nr:hypothetical protein [Rhizobium aethiopicum]MBB4583535.1 hypothetical protein [Rhizobium aethiopicum]
MNNCLLHSSGEAASKPAAVRTRSPRTSEPEKPVGRKEGGVAGDRMMIDAFIAQYGVRRFESGASVSSSALHRFLANRGYGLLVEDERNGRVRLLERNGPTRSMMWPDVVKFCDALRQSEGLEPFVRDAHQSGPPSVS